MKYIGAHVSTVGGVDNAVANAVAIHANAFALFTKNQRQWVAKPYDPKVIERFHEQMKIHGFESFQVLAHDGYLINLGNPDKMNRAKSVAAFIDELHRCEQLGLLYLNTHPGSSLGEDKTQCIKNIADSINYSLEKTQSVSVIIENTAGQGSAVGSSFEEIAEIIELTDDKSRIGVCLDTAHAFAAGYDISTAAGYEKMMAEFDKNIGFSYLKGMHINDSKAKFGSRVDRHHSLLKGFIGQDVFVSIMNDPRTDNIPLILETIDESLWIEEISLLRHFQKNIH